MWTYGRFWTGETRETDSSRSLGTKPLSRNAPSLAAAPGNGVGDLGRGDGALVEGRYEAAIAAYQPLSEGVGPLGDAAKYRLALCNEGQGRYDQAISIYREVASRNASARIVAAASLGQARVWVRMRKPAEAKRLLCDLVLRPRSRPFETSSYSPMHVICWHWH